MLTTEPRSQIAAVYALLNSFRQSLMQNFFLVWCAPSFARPNGDRRISRSPSYATAEIFRVRFTAASPNVGTVEVMSILGPDGFWRNLNVRKTPHVGVVLGGGGVAGAAFELAILNVLESRFGFSVASADVVVGTSAGSIVAALTRVGASPMSVYQHLNDALPVFQEDVMKVQFPRGWANWWRFGVRTDERWVQRSGGAPGVFDSEMMVSWVQSLLGEGVSWPDRPLWVSAYDVRSRQARLFSSSSTLDLPEPYTDDVSEPSLARVITASSAVPFLFSPTQVAGRLYADGGVVSHTHVNSLGLWPDPLDVVIAVAPSAISAQLSLSSRVRKAAGVWGQCEFLAEVEDLRRSSCDTMVVPVYPPASMADLFGVNPLDADQAAQIFERATDTFDAMFTAGEGYAPMLSALLSKVRRSA